jgi:hypothetical protein
MKLSRKILLGLLAVFIMSQFFRPEKNISPHIITDNDISKRYVMPENVHQVFVKKCYDCHSNNTHYAWYYNIQPIGWWMAHHVNEGKLRLDFSEFKTYDAKRANHKLEEISESVTEGWMPLDSYLWSHQDAKVTPEETAVINAWISSLGIETKKN